MPERVVRGFKLVAGVVLGGGEEKAVRVAVVMEVGELEWIRERSLGRKVPCLLVGC